MPTLTPELFNLDTVSNSPNETKKIAKQLAGKIKKIKPAAALVVALEGNLGAGKTVFVKGLAQGLKVEANPVSPTFVLMRSYQIKEPKTKFKNLIHIDAYRLKSKKEAAILGWERLTANPQNLIVIEWPEKLKNLIPPNAVFVRFDHLTKPNQRRIIISNHAQPNKKR